MLTPEKFEPGKVVATPGAMNFFARAGKELIGDLLGRHLRGDWGDLCDEDMRLNDDAVQAGERILSSYNCMVFAPTGEELAREKIWVITEWDRSLTTFLLPSEY